MTEFDPPTGYLESVVRDVLNPALEEVEREVGQRIAVAGFISVGGVETRSWVAGSDRDANLRAVGRAAFRQTGGRHVPFSVQIRVPRDPATGWTGINLNGWIRPTESGITVEPRGKTIVYNVEDWQPW